MNKAYLLLGGNLGNRAKNLETAGILIDRNAGAIVNRSDIFVTKAWGNELQPDFYNQAVCIETKLSPPELLSVLLSIEEQLGRKRTGDKWQARTMDIDILFYNEEIIDTKELKIPHPFMQDRRFVLTPLNQIAGALVHPVLKKNTTQLLAECGDKLEVKILNPDK